MCGILAIIGKGKDAESVRNFRKECHIAVLMKVICMSWKSVLSHERLSIIDLHSGKQPIQGSSTAT
jgi:asparagine synthase (glutamine-hydrolysing)